jgi:hypothetical protein
MAHRNKHIDSFLPYFYQRQTLDIMAFTFIDAYKFLYPSVTLNEAAIAFMKRYGIAEENHNVKSVITTFERVSKDYYDAEKAKNNQREPR